MQKLTAKLEQLHVWKFTLYLGDLEVGGPPVSLTNLADSKPQREDWGEIDEEGGHLYDHMKMLYEEDFCLEPVCTQRTEGAIAL